MRPHKGLALFTLLLVLGIAGIMPISAQEATSTQEATPAPFNGKIAILVVDVFEESSTGDSSTATPTDVPTPTPVPKESLSGKQCALSLDGQDGAIIQGTYLSSALHPFAKPHGRLVFNYFNDVLTQQYGGTGISLTPNLNPLYGLTGIRDVEQWTIPNLANIWLVAVDTHQYAIDDINADVTAAMNRLNTLGVTGFVVNMSFGLVPCDDMPTLSLSDYTSLLETTLGVTCNQNASGFPQLACDLDKDQASGDPFSFVPDLPKIRDAGGDEAVAFALLQLAIMQPKVVSAFKQAIPEPPTSEIKSFVPPGGSISGIQTILIASAGNDGLSYPYFPALDQSVLSVSADYSSYPLDCKPGTENDLEGYLIKNLNLGTPPAATPDGSGTPVPNPYDVLTKRIENPTSNAGEIQENGVSDIGPSEYLVNPKPGAEVLGCLVGTSFAAPLVSLRAAHFLMLPNATVPCVGKAGVQSDPPLAHDAWDNLIIPAASPSYCINFPYP